MNLKKIKVIRSDKRGAMYGCDKLNYIVRKKGTVSADHSHEDPEILYILKGSGEITVGKETTTFKPLDRIEIPSNTYHKLVAFSDIELLEDREAE